MATVEVGVTIGRPLADVYRVLTTPELTPRWSSNAVEEQMTTFRRDLVRLKSMMEAGEL